MLVLRRKIDEQIRIGDSIQITVLQVHRRGVRLGFTAPPEVSICREEVHRKLKAEAAERVVRATENDGTSAGGDEDAAPQRRTIDEVLEPAHAQV